MQYQGIMLIAILVVVSYFVYIKVANYISYLKEIKNRDRFFFHDLINQTHSVLLFLNNRTASKKNITIDESQLLIKEIKIIQTLIKDHYHLKHRDLVNLHQWISLQDAQSEIFHLVNNHLSSKDIKCDFQYQGDLTNLVHCSSFFRIFSNIIKNISASKSKYVILSFNYQKDGLHIEIKNQILEKNDFISPQKLQDLILHEQEDRPDVYSGIGLDSIALLCQELGGTFNFFFDDKFWINSIFLPNPTSQVALAA